MSNIKHCRYCINSEDRNLYPKYMNELALLEPSGDSSADFKASQDVGKIAKYCMGFRERQVR